jgi:hypothetical protein
LDRVCLIAAGRSQQEDATVAVDVDEDIDRHHRHAEQHEAGRGKVLKQADQMR